MWCFFVVYLFRQCSWLSPRENWICEAKTERARTAKCVNAAPGCRPSGEKMRLEHSAECDKRKIIKNLSAEHGQSAAETILNRPIRRGTDCKAFTALQPLNSCWTFAESYGIILSAIAGIVHRLVYQPSKLRRWVRFPLPAPKDLNLERFGSFLFALCGAAILPTGGGNATIEP